MIPYENISYFFFHNQSASPFVHFSDIGFHHFLMEKVLKSLHNKSVFVSVCYFFFFHKQSASFSVHLDYLYTTEAVGVFLPKAAPVTNFKQLRIGTDREGCFKGFDLDSIFKTDQFTNLALAFDQVFRIEFKIKCRISTIGCLRQRLIFTGKIQK